MLPRRQRLRKSLKHFQNLLAGSSDQSKAVFVFGDMRSGTNMLKDCFIRTRRTEVFNESDEEAFDDFMLQPLPVLNELIQRSHATHVVFKALADSARARELLDHFPGSVGLWIYRRYEDVVNSAVRTAHWRSPRENIRLTLEDPERARWRRLNLTEAQLALLREHYESGINEESARALFWHIRNDLYFSQQLNSDERVALLNYEALVSNPGSELKRAWHHAGLQLLPEYFSHVSPKSVGRHHAPEIDATIAELADQMIERLEKTRLQQIESEEAEAQKAHEGRFRSRSNDRGIFSSSSPAAD